MDARGCGRERTLRTAGIVERSAGTPRLSAAAELASSRTEILPYISLKAVTRWRAEIRSHRRREEKRGGLPGTLADVEEAEFGTTCEGRRLEETSQHKTNTQGSTSPL